MKITETSTTTHWVATLRIDDPPEISRGGKRRPLKADRVILRFWRSVDDLNDLSLRRVIIVEGRLVQGGRPLGHVREIRYESWTSAPPDWLEELAQEWAKRNVPPCNTGE